MNHDFAKIRAAETHTRALNVGEEARRGRPKEINFINRKIKKNKAVTVHWFVQAAAYLYKTMTIASERRKRFPTTERASRV